jgi:HPt (histidine-containing phosphotransfer) domain-containing protein
MYEKAIDGALDSFGDKAMGLTQIIHQDLKKYYGAMQQAIKEQNVADAVLAAHSCKSICGLLNVPDAIEVVRQMEQISRDNDLDTYEKLFAEYTPIYTEILAHLSHILDQE